MLTESYCEELPKYIGSNRISRTSKKVEEIARKIRRIHKVSKNLAPTESVRVIRFAINRINPSVLVSMPYTGGESLALFNDLCINPNEDDLTKLTKYLQSDVIKLREIAEGY